MLKRSHHSSGYSIVEIIVVVVIVGILAAIALIGASGAQVQARNSQTASAVQAYKKALLGYLNDNGNYPTPTYGSCLGVGYKDTTGDGVGDCWHMAYPSSENDILLNAIKPYMNNELPLPSTITLPSAPPYDQVGAIVNYSPLTTLDGVPHKWFIAYTMEGNQAKCMVGPVLSIGVYPHFFSAAPATGYTEAYGTYGTGCWLPIPDPEEL